MSDKSSPLFHELDQLLTRVISELTTPSRRALSRTLATGLRKRQSARIGSQKNPDGSSYVPRKRQVLRTQGGIRFLWRGPNGKLQARELRNWRTSRGAQSEKTLTGYDIDRDALRTFRKEDIERYLSIDLTRTEKRRLRPTPLFRRLRTARFLRAAATPDIAMAGFSGKAGSIARVHQYGLVGNVAHKARAKYPQRELLGFTDDDLQWVADTIQAHLTR
ncbi:phage virion morphogenesis protein [Gibbsiella dentisursi]|uniref:Phage virion morphogenesis protein n=1 Tax=Gibbsiella dentisursi TaxID=796890 RepID=A0ABP7M3N5_9GAMM